MVCGVTGGALGCGVGFENLFTFYGVTAMECGEPFGEWV